MRLSLRCSDGYFLLLSSLPVQSLPVGVSHTNTQALCSPTSRTFTPSTFYKCTPAYKVQHNYIVIYGHAELAASSRTRRTILSDIEFHSSQYLLRGRNFTSPSLGMHHHAQSICIQASRRCISTISGPEALHQFYNEEISSHQRSLLLQTLFVFQVTTTFLLHLGCIYEHIPSCFTE